MSTDACWLAAELGQSKVTSFHRCSPVASQCAAADYRFHFRHPQACASLAQMQLIRQWIVVVVVVLAAVPAVTLTVYLRVLSSRSPLVMLNWFRLFILRERDYTRVNGIESVLTYFSVLF